MSPPHCKAGSRRAAYLAVVGLALGSCSLLPGSPHPGAGGPIGRIAVSQGDAQAILSTYRRANGLGVVELDPALQRAAQDQADAMASANELSHDVAGTLPHRLDADKLDRSAAIENVSAGYADLASVIEGWKKSPHHNDNLLFRPMRRMGIAAASAPKTRYKTFWSLIMTN